MKTDYLSPLRYPGAKRKLAPYIKKMLLEYDMTNCVFIEPCCGGASVSLYLLDQKIVSSVILVDKDPWVASFWYMLFRETDNLLDDIRNIDVTVETWNELRAREPQTIREKALYCFFFNRTCYSGILNAGMIGGYNQASKYKIDCRFNKIELLERIKLLAERFSHKVKEIREDSIFNYLDQAELEEHNDYVYYIDPPYIQKGATLYPHRFKTNEHTKLKRFLGNFQKPWILSYHDHKYVRKMYLENGSLESTSLEVIWVADRAKKGTELLISNFPSLRVKHPTPTLPEQLEWVTTLEDNNGNQAPSIEVVEVIKEGLASYEEQICHE